MSINRDIEDYTENYLNSDFETIQVAYRKLELKKWINKYKHHSILEIGCGIDPFFTELDFNDYQYYCIVEPSKIFVNKVKSNIEKSNTKIEIINSFLEQCDIAALKKKKFDFIILSSLLHEVEKPIELLKQLKNVADNNTIIHINVPNVNSFHRLLALESGLIKDTKEKSMLNIGLQQNTNFDRNLLHKMVSELNLKIMDTGSYFIKPFTHKQMYSILNEGIINKNILDGLNNMTKYMPELGSEIFVNVKLK